MKKKQFMSKLAALTMAAAMGLTAVPATAVFAAETSVEASYDIAAKAQGSVTKNGTVLADDDAEAVALLAFVSGKAGSGITTDAANADTTNLKGTGKPFAGKTLHVDDVKMNQDGATGTIQISVEGSDDVYVITVTTETAISKADSDIADALDAFFAGDTFATYNGRDLTAATIKSAVETEIAKTTGDSHELHDAITSNIDLTTTHTVDVKNVTSSADGKTVTGKLTLTGSTGHYFYNFTANVNKNSGTRKEAIQSAISAIEENTYPMPAGTKDGTDVATLDTKLQKDFNDALTGGVTAPAITGKVDQATRTRDGSYAGNVEGNNFKVTLKYSSDSKLQDAEKAANAALKAQGGRTANTIYLESSTAGTSNSSPVAANGTEDTNGQTIDTPITFPSTSSLSKAIQPKASLKAADKDDVVAAVKKVFTDAADAKGYTGDGVEYKAEAVDFYAATGSSTANKSAKADIAANGTKTKGYYLVKVTATIANDFYGWDNSNNNSENSNVWYVEVETPELSNKKVTGIEVSDQTFVQKNEYYASKKADGTALDTRTVNGVAVDIPTYADVFDLKATLTPSDANSKVTWSVKPADKDTPATGAYVENKNGSPVADFTLSKDGKVAVKAGDITSTSGKLIVFAPGKYEVTATVDGKTAKATVTVNGKFNDVSATAYYKNAVDWAYKNNITSGISNTVFGSNTDVTRGQFITWLYKNAVVKDATVEIKDADVKQVFSDVATDKYYAKAVQWAVANGITSGTDATHFSPNAKITRAQAVTMLYAAADRPDTGATGYEGERTTQFTDVKAGAYYLPAVTWAVNNGITSGTSTTTFSPNATAKRAQAITFLYKASNLY